MYKRQLLRIEADTAEDLLLSGSQWGKDITVSVAQNSVIARHPSGETVTVTFPHNVELAKTDNNYTALVRSPRYPVNVAVSYTHLDVYKRQAVHGGTNSTT